MKHIKESLDSFLDSESPGVVAIKGDWGAGKTYFVKKYLKERQQLREKQVSFISLFGLSSIEEIRRQIIPSAISAKALSEGKTRSNIQMLIGLTRTLPKISDFEQLFQAVENQMIRDLLIVFDDVERKHRELTIKSFLGLVNFLSEHLHCKVIIILNVDQLKGDDTDELNCFREKLLDLEILFAPTYEENVELFFHDKEFFDRALNIFRQCGCRNLRVIKRCYQNLLKFRHRFNALGNEAKTELLNQVILLSCLFYQYGADIDFEKLSDYVIFNIYSEDKDKKQIKGSDILKKAEFWPTDFDNIILTYLKNGIFDEASALELINKENSSSLREELKRKQINIYKTVNANFYGDENNFFDELNELLSNHIKDLSWEEVGRAVHYFKIFKLNDDPTKWSDNFIIYHSANFSFEECAKFQSIASSSAAKFAIYNRKNDILKNKHPREIIYSMIQKQGWNPEDVEALNQYDTNFFVNWFKEEEDDQLLGILKEFIKTFNPEATEKLWQEIGNKVFLAFKEISKNNSFIQNKLINMLDISPLYFEASKAIASNVSSTVVAKKLSEDDKLV